MAIVGYVFVGLGVLVYAIAKSAIHEIEAFILFLIAAVLISASNIIKAIETSRATSAPSAPQPVQADEPAAGGYQAGEPY